MPSRLGLLSLLCALALAPGCNELIDTGRFGVRDGSTPGDGGGMDGGGMDAGPDGGMDGGGVDACASNAWYRDSDGDTYGDPGIAMMGCAQPAGYVANADDCDDTTDTIAPGRTEVCDDIDQDCDGAVDEGLMGPIGAPIPIVNDLGIGFTPGEAFVLATNDGYAVFYKRDAATEIRGSFLARDGTFVARDVWIANGPDVSDLAVTRFTTDGLDQLFVLWRQDTTTLRGRLFSTDGVGGLEHTVITIPAGTMIRTLEIQQYGNRLLVSWTEAASRSLATYDPLLGTSGTILVLPNPPGVDSQWRSVTAIQAPTPFAILVRLTVPDGTFDAGTSGLDGGTSAVGTSLAFVRLSGLDSLSIDEASAQTWDYWPRCGSAAVWCYASMGLAGTHVAVGEPGLAIAEGLASTDSLDG